MITSPLYSISHPYSVSGQTNDSLHIDETRDLALGAISNVTKTCSDFMDDVSIVTSGWRTNISNDFQVRKG